MTNHRTEDFDYHAWTNEKAIGKCSPAAEGAWIRTLSTEMWPKKTGEATNTLEMWALLWRTGIDHAKTIISEFRKNKVCVVTGKVTQEITLKCRRLVKHYKELDQGKARQLRYRYKGVDADSDAVAEIYEAYPKKRGGPFAAKKAIAKAIQSGVAPQKLLARIQQLRDAVMRCPKEVRKFLPFTSKFFNQGMCEDDTIEDWIERSARYTRNELPVAKPYEG